MVHSGRLRPYLQILDHTRDFGAKKKKKFFLIGPCMELKMDARSSSTNILVVKQVPLYVNIGLGLKTCSQQVGKDAPSACLAGEPRNCLR